MFDGKLQSSFISSTMAELPYFEKQGRFNQLCLVHALNMLLGGNVLSKRNLDEACETLSPNGSLLSWNPHRSFVGLGNYDVNVAMYILEQQHGLEVSFFDGRKTAQELMDSITQPCNQETSKCDTNANASTTIIGLLVNVPGSLWMLPSISRHWISYRPIGSSWWKLDSSKSYPIEILTDNLLSTIESHLSRGDYILIVQDKRTSGME